MSAPTIERPAESELPDLWFPEGDAPGADTAIYGDDVVAASEQENLAQTAILAAALLEVVELFPLLDPDDLESSGRGWTNRTADVVMRAREKAFDRAVIDYDRFRAIRLGREAAPSSSLTVPLPTTPTRRPAPALPTLSAGDTEQAPEGRTQRPESNAAASGRTSRGGRSSGLDELRFDPADDEPTADRSQAPRTTSPNLPTLPDEMVQEIRRQERRRPKTTPMVDLDDGPADRLAAARTPVTRPMKDGDAEQTVRRVLSGAGPQNMQHRTKTLAARPTFPTKRESWLDQFRRPVLVEVMGAATKQITNGARDANDRMRRSDRVAVRYQRMVRGGNPCAFCLMLGGRGPVYRSEESAERVVNLSAKREVGEPYHDHCRCTSKVAYSPDEPWAGDNLSFRIAWDKYAAGYDRKTSLLRFRRYVEGRDPNSGRTIRSRATQARRPGQGPAAEEVV